MQCRFAGQIVAGGNKRRERCGAISNGEEHLRLDGQEVLDITPQQLNPDQIEKLSMKPPDQPGKARDGRRNRFIHW